MSIEMDNPKTVLEKVDAAHNYVEQIRLALMTGDRAHALKSVDKVSALLFEAKLKMEDEDS